MPTKISKVAKDLNVGVNTAVEFLRKHNINVDDNPNARINDDAVELLIKEYSKDKDFKDKLAKYASEKKEEKKAAKIEKEKTAEIKVVPPVTKGPKVVGKVNIDKKGNVVTPQPKTNTSDQIIGKDSKTEQQPSKPSNQVIASTTTETMPTTVDEVKDKIEEPISKPAPIEQKPVVKTEAKPEPKAVEGEKAINDNKDDEEVFRLNPVAQTPQIKVLGTINLSSLNQSTRPKKKTKEEKRKERNEKIRQQQSANANAGNNNVASAGSNAEKKKRKRIGKEKVDIEKTANQPGFGTENKQGKNNNKNQQNNAGGSKKEKQKAKRPVKVEISEEDVQKQVKETLARLTNKTQKKSVKWRKEKREEMHNRELENAERAAAESKIIKITEFVTANDLANLMEVPINNIIATCMNIGMMVSINQRLDAETINLVAEEFGFTTEYVSAEVSEAIATEEDSEEDLLPRSPIVTVMGHVDHGKTSLLDYIRNANVIAGEAGGITQHIGAYSVKLSDGRNITFLDTPGHEAFTAMRARGAKVTDLAIIIVAADDSVMPQTVEAINHASAAGVPIVFAINKIDKPTANPEKIKEELSAMNYLVEDWGGKYQSQDISAKKGLGVDELMEKVLLEAEMLDLKANPNRKAMGSIIESSLDKGRGYVATVLVQNGTLRVGDIILAGTHYGKVKAMFNERNQRVTEAPPATPVLILGLNGAPTAGDTFNVMETDQEAREIATKREQLQREQGIRTKKRVGLEELGRRRALNDFHELNLIVKGDVDGSIEALSDSLIKLSTEEVQVNVLHKGVGAISESDVTLAAASDAIIIGFQVRPSAAARKEAEKEGVEIRLYSVIYKAIEEVRDAMEGMLSPEIKEEVTGTVEVLQTYHISKVGTIAGAIVRDGKVKRASKVRVIRDGIVKYTGDLGSLKRFKDDVKEVASGFDCGISVNGYNDIKVGDIIEAYEEIAVKKSL